MKISVERKDVNGHGWVGVVRAIQERPNPRLDFWSAAAGIAEVVVAGQVFHRRLAASLGSDSCECGQKGAFISTLQVVHDHDLMSDPGQRPPPT